MPYDTEKTDFKAIAGNAKKSDAFKKMGGDSEPDADDEGGGETADLRDAYQAAVNKDEDAFTASMLVAIRACIANYGPGAK